MSESGATGICAKCGNRVAVESLLDHLAVVHDMRVEISTWPDGSPVIVDGTLEPEDFNP